LFRLEDEDIKTIMDERKREKQEDKVARDKVITQIEADKLARKKMYGLASAEEQPKQVLLVASHKQTKEYTETKLQVNMLNTHIEFYILIITYYIQLTIQFRAWNQNKKCRYFNRNLLKILEPEPYRNPSLIFLGT